MDPAMVVILAVGMLLGFWVGRWWGETRRARYDMKRTWDGRKGYRDGPYH